MKKNPKNCISVIIQPNYNANDPIRVAVREELIRRHIEKGTDFRINWLKGAEKNDNESD